MNILAIESASTVCGTALFLGSKMVDIDEVIKPYIHSERLPLIIDNMLTKHEIKVAELDGIAISEGPGSYTGLRIGMSLAKGLAVTAEIPIVSVPTLEVMNMGISRKGDYWVLLYSHKNIVFAQRFNSGKPVSIIECKIYNSIRYKQAFGFNLNSICNSTEYELSPPSSKYVGKLAIRFYEKWARSNLNNITPNYITHLNLGNSPTH